MVNESEGVLFLRALAIAVDMMIMESTGLLSIAMM